MKQPHFISEADSLALGESKPTQEKSLKLWQESKRPGALGKRARDQLTLLYMPLVKAVVWKRYAKKPSELYDDLVQEGVIALLEAIDAYDPSKGTIFSGFAWSMVDWGLKAAHPKMKSIVNMPVRHHKLWRKASAVQNRLLAQLGREPTFEEIAMECGEPASKVAAVLSIRAVSADAPRGDDTLSTMLDTIKADDPSPEEMAETEQLLGRAVGLVSQLSPTQRDVVTKYLGLKGQEPKNFAELAEEQGKVRQTCSLAFRTAMVTLREVIEA
jgi:RNA polymerase sigma factor (sigma-70 family)